MRKQISTWLAVLGGFLLAINVHATEWETDFAKASTNAAQAGRYLLIEFSGSDWCGWCKKLDKEVFSTKNFTDFAATNLVCVLVDFPHEKEQTEELKKQNLKLAEKYGVQSFPTVVILSPEGKLVDTSNYQEAGAKKYEGGPQAFIDGLMEMIARYEKEHPKKEVER